MSLKQLRESKGLSQNALAKQAGISQSVLSDIEAGNTIAPRMDTLQMLAKALGEDIGTVISAIQTDKEGD